MGPPKKGIINVKVKGIKVKTSHHLKEFHQKKIKRNNNKHSISFQLVRGLSLFKGFPFIHFMN